MAEMEARKRRIEVLLSQNVESNHFQKLRDGRFLCRVCPSRPILDTMPMFTMHSQGVRHQMALSELKKREATTRDELEKRIALGHVDMADTKKVVQMNPSALSVSPLLQNAQKCATKVIAGKQKAECNITAQKEDRFYVSKKKPFFATLQAKAVHTTNPGTHELCVGTVGTSSTKAKGYQDSKIINQKADLHYQGQHCNDPASCNSNLSLAARRIDDAVDFQKQKERELKFRAAGWRRDGQGGWFREENVEFDSDEEDPNQSFD